MAGRTNFVSVTNLPLGFSNGPELYSLMNNCGPVQDMTAVDPTTVIVSYGIRSAADQAQFALDGCTVSGSVVRVMKHFPQTSGHQYTACPAYLRLGQYIGRDSHLMNPTNFIPWGGPAPAPTPAAARPGYSGGNLQPGLLGAVAGAVGGFVSSLIPGPAPSTAQPATQTGPEETLRQFAVPWRGSSTEDCSICLGGLSEEQSSYNSSSGLAAALTLSQCGHSYHAACLLALLAASPSQFLQCPTCKKVYGVRTGTRPTTGSMSHRLSGTSLPGHPNCGTIELQFHFTGGVQGPEHPSPGMPYTASNFPRVAYLPDSEEGVAALHGLYLAWQQRLLFTVGRSITTGRDNCITWNDIHLKTSTGGGEHSYPDPQHLASLKQDLAGFGITEAEISRHRRENPQLRLQGRL